jgi:hypothetical protein
MISHDQYYLYDSINEHNIYNHVSEFIKHIHYNSMLFIIIITILPTIIQDSLLYHQIRIIEDEFCNRQNYFLINCMPH